MAEQFENNYSTLLNGAINSSVTTLTVDAVPTTMNGNFRIKIEDEIILVGAVSGLTFTGCTRGAEGTTAASHSDNAPVSHVLTAAALQAMSPFYFDNLPLHASGDDFAASTLNADWTVRGVNAGQIAFQRGGGSLAQINLTGLSTGSIDRVITSTDEVDILASFSVDAHSDVMIGPYLVSSAGTGIGGALRPTSTPGLVIANLTSYVYSSIGIAGPAIPISGVQSHGLKVWMLLSKRGLDYVVRISYDGAHWSPLVAVYRPSAFTVAKYGFGAFYGPTPGDTKLITLDRLNVLNQFNVGNNLVVTPTSGTRSFTASSQYDGSYIPDNAGDGNTGSAWAAAGADSPTLWWQVDWTVPQTFNRVRLFPRSEGFSQGWLTFSDGTKEPFPWAATNGNFKCFIDLPASKTTSSLRVETEVGPVTGGFSEIEAYLAS